eukprot:2779284-Rhodomonas_salina.2
MRICGGTKIGYGATPASIRVRGGTEIGYGATRHRYQCISPSLPLPRHALVACADAQPTGPTG